MRFVFILSIVILAVSLTKAQDRIFAYTYQTNVLNKGDLDLEFHNTLSVGKVGDYSPYILGTHLDQRFELEVGLGKNVQTAFYFNSELFKFADSTSTDLSQELAISFSNEWKWKLSDPVANKIGFALYEELEFGGNNIESETKLIFDKRWQKDLLSFNIIGTYEIEREIETDEGYPEAAWEHSSPIELNLGYMHFLKPETGIGLELKLNNDIEGEEGWINSVLFLGPACHFSIDRFFANISVLPQLANLHKTDEAPGNRDLNNHEALEVRLLAGYSF